MTPQQIAAELAAKRTDAPTPYALNPPTHTLADCLTMPPAIQQRIEQALKEIRHDN